MAKCNYRSGFILMYVYISAEVINLNHDDSWPTPNGRFQKISILYHGQLLGFLKGRGVYDLKSEGMAEFHRSDFWSRKCRVSSLKTLLLWTFVIRK